MDGRRAESERPGGAECRKPPRMRTHGTRERAAVGHRSVHGFLGLGEGSRLRKGLGALGWRWGSTVSLSRDAGAAVKTHDLHTCNRKPRGLRILPASVTTGPASDTSSGSPEQVGALTCDVGRHRLEECGRARGEPAAGTAQGVGC